MTMPTPECMAEHLGIKAELHESNRRGISSENGKGGGRPHIQVDEIARAFLEQRYQKGGFYTLVCYHGAWYEYRVNYWHKIDGDLIECHISAFLQEGGYGKITRLSTALTSDILHNIKSSSICTLDTPSHNSPCFLPGGETASEWLPMKNCALNIEKTAQCVGKGSPIPPEAMRKNAPDLFSLYGLDYDYDSNATCPKFMKYLYEVQPNVENRESLQMLAGLLLVPDTRYNVCFFLFGNGGTGKSVFSEILTHLVGSANTCSIPLSSFCDQDKIAPLTEKLLNIVAELPVMPENGKSADVEGVLKGVTSGDTIEVRRLYKNPWRAKPIARCVFVTNSIPHFTDRSTGVWDRLRFIPFNQVIRGTEKQNINLIAELEEELPGILNWALVGHSKLRKSKVFPECSEGETLKTEHRNRCDHERSFLQECTEYKVESWVSTSKLYDKYKEWMCDNGYRSRSVDNFKQAVKAFYPKSYEERKRTKDGQIRLFPNIRLL